MTLPQLSEKLRPMFDEPLATATDEDFLLIASELAAAAEESLNRGDAEPTPCLDRGADR
jgi:hypothetical protein